jgi:enoyl-CoA hydratase/carnithine racemase
LELALTCDYRIASDHAVFSFPEITFDLMPGCGATVRLFDFVKKSKGIEMILSGNMVSAQDALSMGLIDAIVDKSLLLCRARHLIMTLGKRKRNRQFSR